MDVNLKKEKEQVKETLENILKEVFNKENIILLIDQQIKNSSEEQQEFKKELLNKFYYGLAMTSFFEEIDETIMNLIDAYLCNTYNSERKPLKWNQQMQEGREKERKIGPEAFFANIEMVNSSDRLEELDLENKRLKLELETLRNYKDMLEVSSIKGKDRTAKIITELKILIAVSGFSEELKQKLESLIMGVNKGEINLFEYRKHDSVEKYDKELVRMIALADELQQIKSRTN
jgi:hypothetical protein